MEKCISVVVPCFNEEAVLEASFQRLKAALDSISGYTWEMILVNDGSRDRTMELIRGICDRDQRVKALCFSRNFGHQVAITAGLDHCTGDCAVVIDADLQDPPEIIPEMVKKWEEGWQIVYGKRRERAGETRFKLWTARVFYRFINRLSDTDIPLDTGDFRLMDRKALEEFLRMRELYRFVRGMVAWIGFRQTFVEYDRDARFAGETKYPLKKMLRLATDAILSFSNTPLKLASIVGFITSAIAFIGILYSLYIKLFTDDAVHGWTFLMIAILFIGGITLLVLGIIGEYVGRIYGEIKRRPLYIVDEKYGF